MGEAELIAAIVQAGPLAGLVIVLAVAVYRMPVARDAIKDWNTSRVRVAELTAEMESERTERLSKANDAMKAANDAMLQALREVQTTGAERERLVEERVVAITQRVDRMGEAHKARTDSLEAALQSAQQRIGALDQEVVRLRAEVATEREARLAAEAANEMMARERDAAVAKADRLRADLRAAQRQISDLEKRIAEVERELERERTANADEEAQAA